MSTLNKGARTPRSILFSACAALACLIGATGAAFAAPAPAGSSDSAVLYEKAKTEGKVVLYSGGPAEPMRNLANQFEKKYPPIKVDIIRLVGPRLFQRFMQETQAKQYVADAVLVSDQPSMVELIKRKTMLDYRVPTADRFDAKHRMQYNAYAPYLTDIALVYNTKKVTPEEVAILKKSWKGVLDPRFKGRFAVSPLACGACYAGVQMFLTSKDYGREFMNQVAAQKPNVYASTVVALDRVIAGESDFVFWTFENAALPKLQQGAPIAWLRPDPTPLFPNSWLGASATAPNPNAARLFMNWVLSEDGAREMQKELGATTTLKGVPDERSVTKEPWYEPIHKVYDVDFERWATSYDDDMKIWGDTLKSIR